MCFICRDADHCSQCDDGTVYVKCVKCAIKTNIVPHVHDEDKSSKFQIKVDEMDSDDEEKVVDKLNSEIKLSDWRKAGTKIGTGLAWTVGGIAAVVAVLACTIM